MVEDVSDRSLSSGNCITNFRYFQISCIVLESVMLLTEINWKKKYNFLLFYKHPNGIDTKQITFSAEKLLVYFDKLLL